jgi:acylphosphatase
MSAAQSTSRDRRRVLVSGRVQDVWFRASTAQRAAAAGADGWVRNLADGRVEAVFEGTPEAVAAMVDFCSRGPALAHVDRIEVIEEPPESLEGFRIR